MNRQEKGIVLRESETLTRLQARAKGAEMLRAQREKMLKAQRSEDEKKLPSGPDDWMIMTIRLKRHEYDKLVALAKSRGKVEKGKIRFTPESCIRDFIKGCVLDGGGWESPNDTAVKHEAKKRKERAAAKR